MMPKLFAFLIGALVGLVCVGGLFWGIQLLFKLKAAEAEDKVVSEAKKFFQIFLALLVLLGQFVLAGLILYFTPVVRQEPVPMALGLAATNLLLPLLARAFVK